MATFSQTTTSPCCGKLTVAVNEPGDELAKAKCHYCGNEFTIPAKQSEAPSMFGSPGGVAATHVVGVPDVAASENEAYIMEHGLAQAEPEPAPEDAGVAILTPPAAGVEGGPAPMAVEPETAEPEAVDDAQS